MEPKDESPPSHEHINSSYYEPHESLYIVTLCIC